MKIFLSGIESKAEQSEAGRALTIKTAREIFGLENPEIEVVNKKPRFVNSDLHFSISHSEKLVAVCFDSEPTGFDIEFMKERDFEKLAKRYNIPAEKEAFYRFWTAHEAKIKLQAKPLAIKTFMIQDGYMASIASVRKFELPDFSEFSSAYDF
ncbi:MAG: hypothetical protein LBJ74_02640 [Heliobacteriaceae bacterium]|jgi:4'-phosphopantetheinyl transferase|nr:hypothetical protein [Heliobacteriaceae bacterium]